MKPEYREGPKAKEEFERTMVALFKAPKSKAKEKPKKEASVRKSKNRDKD